MDIVKYWQYCIAQDADKMRKFFHSDAYVNWHNTNEHFTLDEFIRANCEYPGSFSGDIERIEVIGDLIISAVHIYSKHEPISVHVTSFIKTNNNKIESIDEYWGDDGEVPKWRQDMNIGRPIK